MVRRITNVQTMLLCRWLLVVMIILLGLPPIMRQVVNAADLRRWSVTLSGPDRVVADHDYIYTVALTNDGGPWPIPANPQGFFRLAFDLTERYNDGTVGVSDILVHPTGPQAADGSLPCAAHGGCWFTRVGSQVDFVFAKENVTVPTVMFDIIIHTASVFRPGDTFAVSATLQGAWKAPLALSDTAMSPDTTEGDTGAMIIAEYPPGCASDGDSSQWRDGFSEGCPDATEII